MFRDDDWVKVVTVILSVVVGLLYISNQILVTRVNNLEKRIDQQQIKIDYQLGVINNINRKVQYPGG